MNGKKIILIFMIFSGFIVFGKEGSRLDEYLSILKANNPKLKSIEFRYKAALELARSEKYLPDPVFTSGIYLQSIETKVGAQKSRFGISQKIPFKGKLKLKMFGKIEKAKAIKEIYKQTELDLKARFKKGYYSLCYLEDRKKIVLKHIELLSNLHSVLLSAYETGTADYSSILRIENEIDVLKDSLKTIEEMEESVIAKLNELMNRDPYEKIEPSSLDSFEIVKLSSDVEKAILGSLFQTSPYLRSINYRIKSERFGKELAQKDRYPDFTVGLDWINTSKVPQSTIADNGKDGIIFKLGITIPLWTKKYNYRIKAADNRYLQTVKEHVNSKNEKTTQIEEAFFSYSDSLRKLSLYKDSIIPKTKESLDILVSAYESGKGDYAELIDTQRMLLQFELEVLKSKENILIAIADIERISGIENLSNYIKEAK